MTDKGVPPCKSCKKRDMIEVHRLKGRDMYYCKRCERATR